MTKRRCADCDDLHVCLPAPPPEPPPGTNFTYVKEFVETGVFILGQGERLRVTSIYTLYRNWCAVKEINPVGMRQFNRMLQALGCRKQRLGGWYWWTTFPYAETAPVLAANSAN